MFVISFILYWALNLEKLRMILNIFCFVSGPFIVIL